MDSRPWVYGGVINMEQCLHSRGGYCPISKDKCPGVCVYGEILENINVGIIVLDIHDEVVIFSNRAVTDIFQDSIDLKNYEVICDLLIHDNELAYPFDRTLEYGGRLLGHSTYRISERFIWIFVSDITEKARLESIAEAVNLMNNMGYIFSGIRHEIGNPINSLKMTLSVLKNNIDMYSKETVLEYVDRSLGEIHRMEYLLKSLKNFNMYEDTDVQKVHMPSFLERFTSLIKKDFEEGGTRIEAVCSPEAEWGFTDQRALQQVLLNIMANASDALEEVEDPRIKISIRKIRNHIQLNVIDNGTGIPVEHQKDIFRPFFTTKNHGTGLGLVIAKKMLSKMGGTIEIKSTTDNGTTVKISIPGERN